MFRFYAGWGRKYSVFGQRLRRVIFLADQSFDARSQIEGCYDLIWVEPQSVVLCV